jgi:hypothetical protein
MKTKSLIIIACLVFFASYATMISYAQGPEDVLNPVMIMYFPSIVMQLIANEGNGIICVDACGPCSAWGTYYVLIDGKCINGPDGKVCSNNAFGEQWRFFDDRCSSFIPERVPYEFTNEYVNANIIACSDISAKDQVCRPKINENCSFDETAQWKWASMYELCFKMTEKPASIITECKSTTPEDMVCNPKENNYVCPPSQKHHGWSYNDLDNLCYKWST